MTHCLASLAALASAAVVSSAQIDGSSLVQVQIRAHSTPRGDLHRSAERRYVEKGPVRQQLSNYVDMQYFASITVGGQEITGIIDTGSFELVVFETHCTSCGMAAKYNKLMSDKHHKGKVKRGLFYGSGDIYAVEAFDTVRVGHSREVNQSFWEGIEAFMPVLDQARFQSIVGVGPPEMPPAEAWKKALTAVRDIASVVSDGAPLEPWQLDKVQNETEFSYEVSLTPTMLTSFNVTMFSLCLLNNPGSPGYFIWDDDAALRQPHLFKRVPVIGRHTWTVRMTNVRLMPRSISGRDPVTVSCENGCGAIVDSGTSLLMMPSDVVDKLNDALAILGADCMNMRDLPDIVFTLGNYTFSLPPDAYLADVAAVPAEMASFARLRTLTPGYSECQLTVMESYSSTSWGPLWILGMPFFRKYYTTFNVGRNHDERALFVAPASSDCEPSELEFGLRREVEHGVFRRKLDLSQMYISPLVKEAEKGNLMHL
mmetsp:Transcript_83343/g.231276  ORF Transcript_83343/g.231276 Transcript_83343/m.231276 type:complete len:484 (-) Transcript_83343:103-1554(-)